MQNLFLKLTFLLGFLTLLVACSSSTSDDDNDGPDDEPEVVVTPLEYPTADAGDDATSSVGSRVTLDGSSSDSGYASEPEFQWEILTKPAGSNTSLQNATTATPSFSVDEKGRYQLQLTVTNEKGVSDVSFVEISTESEFSISIADIEGFDNSNLSIYVDDQSTATGEIDNQTVTLSDSPLLVFAVNADNDVSMFGLLNSTESFTISPTSTAVGLVLTYPTIIPLVNQGSEQLAELAELLGGLEELTAFATLIEEQIVESGTWDPEDSDFATSYVAAVEALLSAMEEQTVLMEGSSLLAESPVETGPSYRLVKGGDPDDLDVFIEEDEKTVEKSGIEFTTEWDEGIFESYINVEIKNTYDRYVYITSDGKEEDQAHQGLPRLLAPKRAGFRILNTGSRYDFRFEAAELGEIEPRVSEEDEFKELNNLGAIKYKTIGPGDEVNIDGLNEEELDMFFQATLYTLYNDWLGTTLYLLGSKNCLFLDERVGPIMAQSIKTMSERADIRNLLLEEEWPLIVFFLPNILSVDDLFATNNSGEDRVCNVIASDPDDLEWLKRAEVVSDFAKKTADAMSAVEDVNTSMIVGNSGGLNISDANAVEHWRVENSLRDTSDIYLQDLVDDYPADLHVAVTFNGIEGSKQLYEFSIECFHDQGCYNTEFSIDFDEENEKKGKNHSFSRVGTDGEAILYSLELDKSIDTFWLEGLDEQKGFYRKRVGVGVFVCSEWGFAPEGVSRVYDNDSNLTWEAHCRDDLATDYPDSTPENAKYALKGFITEDYQGTEIDTEHLVIQFSFKDKINQYKLETQQYVPFDVCDDECVEQLALEKLQFEYGIGIGHEGFETIQFFEWSFEANSVDLNNNQVLNDEVNVNARDPYGVHQYFYPDGAIRELFTFEEGAEKQISYFENGVVRSEANAINGMFHGTSYYNYESGNRWYEEIYVDGNPTVSRSFYDLPERILKSESPYSQWFNEESQEYQWTTHVDVKYYYESGALKRVTPYVYGTKQGISTEYYESGAVESTTPYVDGVRNGTVTEYYESGAVESTTPYVDGVRNGTVTEYYESGAVSSTTPYIDNARNGTIRTYYSDGTLKSIYTYINGGFDGTYWEYYSDGGKEYKRVYEDDVLIQSTWYYSSPNRIRTHYELDSSGNIIYGRDCGWLSPDSGTFFFLMMDLIMFILVGMQGTIDPDVLKDVN